MSKLITLSFRNVPVAAVTKNLFLFMMIAIVLLSCSKDESETDAAEFLKNTTWIDDFSSNTSVYKLEFGNDGRTVIMTTTIVIGPEQNPIKANYNVLSRNDQIELFEPGKEEKTYSGFINFDDIYVMILTSIQGEMMIYTKQ
jgi:hypothetical protein